MSSNNTLPQLAAFALVAEEYERSGDAVRGLRPLFASALSHHAGREFSPDGLSKSYAALFGVPMEPHVARSLEPKLLEIGLLENVAGKLIVSASLTGFVPPEEMEEELSSLVRAFSTWASGQFAQRGYVFEESEIEGELLARLSRPEFAAGFFDEDEQARNARFRAQLFSDDSLVGRERDGVFDYLVAKFITFAHAHAPEVFESMARVSSGAVIAEAVAGLASPTEFGLPSGGLRVVVDGPLLLDYLDLNTPQQHVYAKGMLDELRDLGFMLMTFDHVIDEMRLLINASLKEYSAGREYGPLGDRLRSEAGFSTYATVVRDSIERRLHEELGLGVLRYDLYDQGDREKYFSSDQLDSLRNSLGHAHFQLERRERDAKSIAGVIRLKKDNRRPAGVFDAGTIFLTRNSRLCKDANRFLALGRGEADPRFTVLLDSQLLPVVWFSRGARARFADMSRARLIANCAAAMVPQREVVHKIADYLSGMSPKLKEEFSALMADSRAKLCPMNFTLGISSTLDQQSARELLEQMKTELAAPLVEQAREREVQHKGVVGSLRADAAKSKEAVLVLQDKVSRFDAELAQALLDRDRSDAARADRDKTIMRVAASKESEANQLLAACDQCTALVKKVVARALWAIVLASAIYIIVTEDDRGYFAIVGSLASAAFFGTGQRYADELLERALVRLQSSRRARAQRLLAEAGELRSSVLH